MPPRKGQKTIEEKIVGAPGYIPPERRPKCHTCSKVLVPHVIHKLEGHRLTDEIENVTYGYNGCGIFCTQTCGFNFGFAVAKRVLHHKRRTEGSSGNPLIDDLTIPPPSDMV